MWKRSFLSTVRPSVHTNPSRKRSFLSTVRPTVHINPSRKRSFLSTVRPTVQTNPSRKRSFLSTIQPTVHTNPSRLKTELSENALHTSKNSKMLALGFNMDEKRFANRTFRATLTSGYTMISLPEVSSSITPNDRGLLHFQMSPRLVWTQNIWCLFRVRKSLQIYPRREKHSVSPRSFIPDFLDCRLFNGPLKRRLRWNQEKDKNLCSSWENKKNLLCWLILSKAKRW